MFSFARWVREERLETMRAKESSPRHDNNMSRVSDDMTIMTQSSWPMTDARMSRDTWHSHDTASHRLWSCYTGTRVTWPSRCCDKSVGECDDVRISSSTSQSLIFGSRIHCAQKCSNKVPVLDLDFYRYCWILHVPNKTLTLFVEIDSMIDISWHLLAFTQRKLIILIIRAH